MRGRAIQPLLKKEEDMSHSYETVVYHPNETSLVQPPSIRRITKQRPDPVVLHSVTMVDDRSPMIDDDGAMLGA